MFPFLCFHDLIWSAKPACGWWCLFVWCFCGVTHIMVLWSLFCVDAFCLLQKIFDCWASVHLTGYMIHTESILKIAEGIRNPEMPEKTVGDEVAQTKVQANNSMVFVWDLDETLIIFQTLSNGQYAKLFSGFKDPWEGTMLGHRWEQLILEVCDDYFFYKQVKAFHHRCMTRSASLILRPEHLKKHSCIYWLKNWIVSSI